ncbi:MAG: TetR/AcrR family transcriptional regulator [Solirubrobacteraceae bacterium]
MTEGPGLRERKNARTREAIERAAAELALEQGYDHTTVDQIAERADVAPRTVYVRYPTKEAILFSQTEGAASFREWIDGKDDDLIERLGRFVQARVAAGQDNAELARLKMRAIWTDPYLRRVLRGKLEDAEQLISASLAAELGLPSDDSGPRVFAAAITGLFVTMAEKAVAHPDSFDPLSECARGLLFLRAGLDALKRQAAS